MTGQAPLIGWYGDDFTGAAAVMEVLEFSGFPSVLFLDPPNADLLARFPSARCIGIAGDARTRDPDWMRTKLPTIFAALRGTGAGIVHHKICSTLDSAPKVGSIGCAAELGLKADDTALLIVAAPRIGRWQIFGTLFAQHSGGLARLDRHPTMSRHPITPMQEADVRLHLAGQTALPIGLVDVLDLKHHPVAALAREKAKGARIVAVDLLDEATLLAAGGLLHAEAAMGQIFVLGSQGVEDAFVAAAISGGHRPPAPRPARPVDRIAIASGSCSPETALQIAKAEAQGFAILHVDAAQAVDPRTWAGICATVENEATEILARGQSVIIASARGPDDPSIAITRNAQARAALTASAAAEMLGTGFGSIMGRLRDKGAARRFAVAGGDTSSFATRAFGALALTAQAAIAPAVPLLHAHFSKDAAPCDWIVKGGQMGQEDLFLRMRDGVA